jgi:hypothetical protein
VTATKYLSMAFEIMLQKHKLFFCFIIELTLEHWFIIIKKFFQENYTCVLCNTQLETRDHLFFHCPSSQASLALSLPRSNIINGIYSFGLYLQFDAAPSKAFLHGNHNFKSLGHMENKECSDHSRNLGRFL